MTDNTLSIERGVLLVTCYKCTRQRHFYGPDQTACELAAHRAGWVEGRRGMICPACPAVRERKIAA